VVDGVATGLFELRFAATWTGATSTDWTSPANWGACAVVPDQYTDVIIPAGMPRYPQVTSHTTIRSLKADPGASVTVQEGIRLDIGQ
jgi:hypothetical protein